MIEKFSQTNLETTEKLRENLGVVLCAKNKEGKLVSIQEQIKLAEEIGLRFVQFDFRHIPPEEMISTREALMEYRRQNPETQITIHGDNPLINPEELNFINEEKIRSEMDLLLDIKGDSYTVHPPAINSKTFEQATPGQKERIMHNFAHMFFVLLERLSQHDENFCIAFENMPNKGLEGSWGQTIDNMLFLLDTIRRAAVKVGIPDHLIGEHLGVTFDVNHALHGISEEEYSTTLESWFSELGESIRVIHIYVPSKFNNDFRFKLDKCQELASKFSPKARIYLESKQSAGITKSLLDKSRTNIPLEKL
jgi:hypothetical protein